MARRVDFSEFEYSPRWQMRMRFDTPDGPASLCWRGDLPITAEKAEAAFDQLHGRVNAFLNDYAAQSREPLARYRKYMERH